MTTKRQKGHKEMQTNCKDTQNNYKKRQNNYTDTHNNQKKDLKRLERHKTTRNYAK